MNGHRAPALGLGACFSRDLEGEERHEVGKAAGPGFERSVGASGARLPEETRQSSNASDPSLLGHVMGSPAPSPAAVLMLPDS